MKKTAVIVFAFLFALTAAISVSAADMTHNVGQLYVPYASEKPEIDGRLDLINDPFHTPRLHSNQNQISLFDCSHVIVGQNKFGINLAYSLQ